METEVRPKPGRAMRVIILADTHGFLDPRVAALASSCDLAVHAGDIGGASVLEELRRRTKRVVAVRGNNDVAAKWAATESGLLRKLPAEATLALPGGKLAVTHGHTAGAASQRHERLRARYRGARAVVYGHSHRLVCDRKDDPWVFNPGAAGFARTFGGPSCLLLTARKSGWQVQAIRFTPLDRKPAGGGRAPAKTYLRRPAPFAP
ncbi:MAG TPA: metallophosphoesterase family protein [Candidatus Acidoferrales bacterium]|nr:metallophosphoesterase family protein [Candidatus Acidoferrales bacterium]